MAIPTERVSGAIDVQLKALNSGGVMTEAYPITVVEDVIGLESKIQTEIASAGSIKFEVVDALPTTGQQANVIYLVPAAGTLPEQNIYDEYIWMVASGTQAAHWEIIGTTQTDVSNKMNKSGTYTNNHILLGLAGGTAIDGGKYLGSATFNGTPSNYMAREDGVKNYVSTALNGTSDHVVAYSGGGKLKDTGKIVGGSAFVDLAESPETYLATEAGVRAFMSTTDAADSLPAATSTQRGTVYFVDDLDEGQMASPSATAPSVAAVNSALATTQPRLTFNAPLVSGANNTISINMATTTSSGAVVLTNTPSASGGVAATPALVSTALNGTSNHVVAYSAGGQLKDTGKVVGGATFAATPVSTTLATELGVSKFVSAYVSASAITDLPLAGYSAASSGLMYVVSSGGALTITSGGLNINAATTSTPGVVRIGSNIEVTAAGLISVPMAEIAGIGENPGVVLLTDNVTSGGSYATTQQAVYDHVSSTIADTVVPATSARLGTVRIGSNISLVSEAGEDALISVPNATSTGAGVARLYNTINTSTNGGVTPAAVSSYLNTFVTGINAVAPLNDNITATGGTISISSATTTQSGAVLIMAGGPFTSAANKVATEGAVFSNCIFYSIV